MAELMRHVIDYENDCIKFIVKVQQKVTIQKI